MLTNYTNRVISVAMKPVIPSNVAGLIEFVTPAALKKAIGISDQAISNAKSRGAIPPRHWPAVIELAKQKGLTDFRFETILALHRDPSPSAAKPKLAREARA